MKRFGKLRFNATGTVYRNGKPVTAEEALTQAPSAKQDSPNKQEMNYGSDPLHRS